MKVTRNERNKNFIEFFEIDVGDTFKSTEQDYNDDEVYMKIKGQNDGNKHDVILINSGISFPSSDFSCSEKFYLIHGSFVMD